MWMFRGKEILDKYECLEVSPRIQVGLLGVQVGAWDKHSGVNDFLFLPCDKVAMDHFNCFQHWGMPVSSHDLCFGVLSTALALWFSDSDFGPSAFTRGLGGWRI